MASCLSFFFYLLTTGLLSSAFGRFEWREGRDESREVADPDLLFLLPFVCRKTTTFNTSNPIDPIIYTNDTTTDTTTLSTAKLH